MTQSALAECWETLKRQTPPDEWLQLSSDALDERNRQIQEEGFAFEADKGKHEQLFAAGMCYWRQATNLETTAPHAWTFAQAKSSGWPWAAQYWKPRREGEPNHEAARRCRVRGLALLLAAEEAGE